MSGGKFFKCALVVIVVFFVTNQVTLAATIYSNSSTGDDSTGDGTSATPYATFHKAYTSASSGDTINLTGTFTWTDAAETGDTLTAGYTLSKNLTITGQSASTTIVRAHSASSTTDRRVFTVPASVTVTFENLSVQNGNVSADGGGVLVLGSATMNQVDIYNNRSSGNSGGGVNVNGSLTIKNSTVRNNTANYKGGGLNRGYYAGDLSSAPGASDTLDIISSTIVSNKVMSSVAYLEGGGVFFRRGNGSITNSTISLNQVVNGGTSKSTHGVGTDDASSVVYIKNNIIAGNILSTNGGDIGHRSGSQGTFTDNGGNVIGRYGFYKTGLSASATTWLDATAYNIAIDGTYVLQDGVGATSGTLNLDTSLALNDSIYGTMTLALTDAASIAINAGATGSNNSITVPSYDQRNAAFVGSPDAGAYEYGGTPSSSSSEESSGNGHNKPYILAIPPKPQISLGQNGSEYVVAGRYDAKKIITSALGVVYWNSDLVETTTEFGGYVSSFTKILRDLECGETYLVKAYARNSVATTYSDTLSFDTETCTASLEASEEIVATQNESSEEKSLLELLREKVSALQNAWQKTQIASVINAVTKNNPSPTTTWSDRPDIDLELGDTGVEVTKLQNFLIEQGVGPAAKELERVGASGYFGQYTKNALGELQIHFGIAPHAGYYGYITRDYFEVR